MTRWPSAVRRWATSFQLEESANAPWTRTMVDCIGCSFRVLCVVLNEVGSGEDAAEHPGPVLVGLDPLREEVGRGFVVGLLDGWEDRLGRADDRVLTGDEAPYHLGRVGLVVVLGDGGPSCKLAVAGRRGLVERPDPLGDEVPRDGELEVLGLEEQVQRREQRAGDVPVVVVRL